MRYAEKLEQLPVAGKAEEMRLIQVNKRTHHALDQVVQIFYTISKCLYNDC